MNLLLDTCALYWVANDAADLSASAREAIEGAWSVFVSPVSAWEIGLKVRKGKLDLSATVESWYSRILAQHDLEELPLGGEAAIRSTALPSLHNDPADRLLIAVAQIHDLVLLTPDEKIHQYPEVRLLW